MADNTKIIKTIIVIRNDSEANLEANKDSLILRKGEMCWTISDDVNVPSKLKVGNGTATWGELPYVEFGGGSGTSNTFDSKFFKITGNLVSLVGADTATAGQSFKLSDDGTSIVWFTSADKASVDANKTLIDTLQESLTNDYYTKAETDGLVSKVFKFMGTKTSKAELDAITDAKVGDVWIVKGPTDPEGNLYVYAEDADGNGYWEDFPITVDLSNYVLTTDFEALKTRVTTLETDVADLKTAADDNKDYIDSIKPTVDSLPDTIFSALEVQTAANGDMKILGTHVNKDTDGSYNIGGEAILATLKAVTPNGNPGLMTGEDKAKLDQIFDVIDNGGEANVIEDIKVGGTSLNVNSVDKSVNIPVGGTDLGVVKNYSGDADAKPVNSVEIDENGIMNVPEIHVESLVQDEDTDFIISGGDASAGGAGAGA